MSTFKRFSLSLTAFIFLLPALSFGCINMITIFNSSEISHIHTFHEHYKRLGVSNFTYFFEGNISSNPRVQRARRIFARNSENVTLIDFNSELFLDGIPVNREKLFSSAAANLVRCGWILYFKIIDYLYTKEPISETLARFDSKNVSKIIYETSILYVNKPRELEYFSYNGLLDFEQIEGASEFEQPSFGFNSEYVVIFL